MPSTIFELFGYPVSDTSDKATDNRRLARCPFMGQDCDGGGNRYLSSVKLDGKPELREYFMGREIVHAGVCSLLAGGKPWIVCPRRLLSLGRERAGVRTYQIETEQNVLRLLGYVPGTRLGIWPELKIKYKEIDTGKTFDYTFDYLVMPIGRVNQHEAQEMFGIEWDALKRVLVRAGYAFAIRGIDEYVEDCPVGVPGIIEIMTSSTSGGDKSKRTAIPLAFEDAILKGEHAGPGINYRQVWARMASQLIVKSEVGLNWGGKAIWLVQDALVGYISRSTALDIGAFLADHTSEVNMLSFSYGNDYVERNGVIELTDQRLYSGPISSDNAAPGEMTASFQDIVRAPTCPSKTMLLSCLAKRKPVNDVIVR